MLTRPANSLQASISADLGTDQLIAAAPAHSPQSPAGEKAAAAIGARAGQTRDQKPKASRPSAAATASRWSTWLASQGNRSPGACAIETPGLVNVFEQNRAIDRDLAGPMLKP